MSCGKGRSFIRSPSEWQRRHGECLVLLAVDAANLEDTADGCLLDLGASVFEFAARDCRDSHVPREPILDVALDELALTPQQGLVLLVVESGVDLAESVALRLVRQLLHLGAPNLAKRLGLRDWLSGYRDRAPDTSKDQERIEPGRLDLHARP
nr:hypothetical protein [Nocardioides iriomotensis]